MFLSYGVSSVGPFREYIHIIHARFRDEDVGFVPHIFISNERGMLAGREREGYSSSAMRYGLGKLVVIYRRFGIQRLAPIAYCWKCGSHDLLQLVVPATSSHRNLSV